VGRARVALFLTEATNHYQKLLESDATAAAERNGFELALSFCSLSVARQVEQLRSKIQESAEHRPRAIIVMPAQEGTLRDEARLAARAGIAWVVLNRRGAFLESLPSEFPALPIFAVSPDDFEIGRIQGQQLRASLSRGARALLVRGGSGTSTAVDREAGLREALARSEIELDVLYASWTLDGAKKALDVHLTTPGRGRRRLDAIVCQNDSIAVGAMQALEQVAIRRSQPELGQIKIFGCDGLVEHGQRYVKQGKFTATVLVPSTTGPAIDALARVFGGGTPPPSELILKSKPFPALPGKP